jgi:hypothetical protein
MPSRGSQIALDKTMIVAKLRGARGRKRRENGWCEGGSPGSEVPRPFNPATIKAMIEGPMPSSAGEDQ